MVVVIVVVMFVHYGMIHLNEYPFTSVRTYVEGNIYFFIMFVE
jgi:hypothetical protein